MVLTSNIIGKYEYFYQSNVVGTRNILEFCKKSNASLAHISTTSVGGFSNINDIKTLDEDSIYIKQFFNNHVYMITKYLAEIEILNYINQNFVSAKIFRVGNMMPRISDHKFQINLHDNAFISRLNTITTLGYITPEYKNVYFDITPVDLCSKAILTILQSTPYKQTIYHIYNNNQYSIDSLLHTLDISLKEIPKQEYINKIIKLDNPLHSHLLNDLKNNGIVESNVINEKTMTLLKNLNFDWPNLSNDYIKNLINLYQKRNDSI